MELSHLLISLWRQTNWINMQGKAMKQAFPAVWWKIWMGNCNLGSDYRKLKWLRKRKKTHTLFPLCWCWWYLKLFNGSNLRFWCKKRSKKIDSKLFMIPSNQLKQDTWNVRRRVQSVLSNTDTKGCPYRRGVKKKNVNCLFTHEALSSSYELV